VQGKKPKPKKGRRDKGEKSKEKCGDCGKIGHSEPDCWSKGGGKEGQGPRQKKSTKGEKNTESAAVANGDNTELFMFTCTSDYTAVAEALQLPKEKRDTCIDSGASSHYCPDRNKFQNY